MSSPDFKCKYCGESTGVNFDICQDCANKQTLLNKIVPIDDDFDDDMEL